jgi:glucosamine-6-phosphate deaminase
MRTELLDPVGASGHNVRLLRGDAPDLAAECRAYEEAIARAGGIDLAILGLGDNGHIAFNEPGTPWDSPTHVAALSARTREVNQPVAGAVIPTHGLTMGVATIRQARAILLLVAGAAKQAALAALRRGMPDPRWPVTGLIGHADVTVICEARLREP